MFLVYEIFTVTTRRAMLVAVYDAAYGVEFSPTDHVSMPIAMEFRELRRSYIIALPGYIR